MKNFIIKELVTRDIVSQLDKIGFDLSYQHKAAEKYIYKTLKIFGLSLPQANILKQTALSLGCDCAVHKEVLTSNIKTTDAILGGSYSQLKKICEKLEHQPFSMKDLAKIILEQISVINKKTQIVGILNITPDSFSDGGLYFSPNDAKRRIYEMIEEGADMIDIGAESTRPGAQNLSAKEQIERLKPILENLPHNFQFSIDTRDSEVARFALDNGVNIINDVSAMAYDKKMADIVAEYKAGIVLQHSTAKAEYRPIYTDVVEQVYLSLLERIQFAQERGIEKIIIDPGIGFGKSKEQCFEILNRIEEFSCLKHPLMIGISRKSFLGLENSNNNSLKDSLSLALSYPLIQKQVDYLRVHNVKLHRQLLNSVI